MSDTKDKLSDTRSIVLGGNRWFDRYVDICKSIHRSSSIVDIIDGVSVGGNGDDGSHTNDSELYLDVLKDLCNDSIGDNLVIHLLSCIEQMVPNFDNIDKVEQTAGSLLNIYQTSTRSDSIRQKYLITTTVIITYHSQMSDGNWSLKRLFDSFIEILIKNAETSQISLIGLSSAECLREIGSTTPALLYEAYNSRQLRRHQTLIMSSLMKSSTCMTNDDIQHIIQCLPTMKSIDLYHTLSLIYDTIEAQNYHQLLSPMIFKPYLTQLIVSTEVHGFHLSLKLFQSFGLELFSTTEEQLLIRQLFIVATHPSLSIAHRLLILDYTRSIVSKLNLQSIDWSNLEITGFDGPDSQEKKLAVLIETQGMDNQNLLVCLKPLIKRSLTGNFRASNSFYRTIDHMLAKRPDITPDIQDVLISVIFKLPDPHIRRSLVLFDVYRDLAKGTVHKLIANLSNIPLADGFKSVTEYMHFMSAFDWIFKHKDLELNEKQLEILLQLINSYSKRWPTETSGRTIDCCTACLYNQPISGSVKQLLVIILQWLMNDRKNDLSITSLAQIYILALNTLDDDIRIKKVFTNSDDQSNTGEEDIVENLSANIPFSLTRVTDNNNETTTTTTTTTTRKKQKLNEKPYCLTIMFELNINEEYRQQFQRIYGLILSFVSSDDTVVHEQAIPVLKSNDKQLVCLKLHSLVKKPLELTVSAVFNDFRGTNYRCDHFYRYTVSLKDLLLPIDLQNTELFDQLCQSVLKSDDSMQTVICVQQFDSIDRFLAHNRWLIPFIIDNTVGNCKLVSGTTPDRLLLASIKIVNKFVNLFIYTNNYEL
ncbi:uncharacterized protein LOC128966025, partial [Oppia nitens]|uniref:uncharacterized protein LOC128966025 n=1 Tax=Oppia nitens TaxID=1686743 RepID=UPI0023D9A1FF